MLTCTFAYKGGVGGEVVQGIVANVVNGTLFSIEYEIDNLFHSSVTSDLFRSAGEAVLTIYYKLLITITNINSALFTQ